MSALDRKIDFAVLFTVTNANPNGDPLTGNRPREDFEGFGEVSDVCLKRKIRNRLQDMGERIFVQSADRADDGCNSLKSRAEAQPELKRAEKAKDNVVYAAHACKTWYDVRAFGQVFAFKGDDAKGLSVGVRGAVSLQSAFSVDPVDTESIQITKSVNNMPSEKKDSATMGMKHRVPFGLYVSKGSINCELAKKNGFSAEDAEKLHCAIKSMFDGDMSAARPEGSIEVRRVIWWTHSAMGGSASTAQVHRNLRIIKKEGVDVPRRFEDYDIFVDNIPGVSLDDWSSQL